MDRRCSGEFFFLRFASAYQKEIEATEDFIEKHPQKQDANDRLQ